MCYAGCAGPTRQLYAVMFRALRTELCKPGYVLSHLIEIGSSYSAYVARCLIQRRDRDCELASGTVNLFRFHGHQKISAQP